MCASADHVEVGELSIQRLYNVLGIPLVSNKTYYDQSIMAVIKDAGRGARREYSQIVLGPLHEV